MLPCITYAYTHIQCCGHRFTYVHSRMEKHNTDRSLPTVDGLRGEHVRGYMRVRSGRNGCASYVTTQIELGQSQLSTCMLVRHSYRFDRRKAAIRNASFH
jgi:hypothetical protein